MEKDEVLFVDDDVVSHLANCDLLRQSGYEVIEANSVPDACTALDQHPHLAALVTDIDLGAGADGFELARRARAAQPGLPVIYISGTAAKRHRAEGVRNSAFIAKPFDPDQILDALTHMPPVSGPIAF